MNKKLSPPQKLAVSGAVVALYAALMYATQGIAFGQYQIRVATSLYALGAAFPFLIFPLGLANMLSNIMGSFGILDVLGGFAAGFLTAAAARLLIKLRLNDAFAALPIIFIPGLLVPVWLSPILNIPYPALALSLCIGQIIPGILGVFLLKAVRKMTGINTPG